MQESSRAEQWLYATLTGDGALAALVGARVYGYLAPQGATDPYVLYSHQGAHDVMTVGAIRVMNSMLYQVKAVTSGGSMAGAMAVADRIDAVLHGTSGTTADGRVLSCARETDISYVEVDGAGVRHNHLGGIYRLQVRPL